MIFLLMTGGRRTNVGEDFGEEVCEVDRKAEEIIDAMSGKGREIAEKKGTNE